MPRVNPGHEGAVQCEGVPRAVATWRANQAIALGPTKSEGALMGQIISVYHKIFDSVIMDSK